MSADKDYLKLPLAEVLEDTAARSPTPGGGSIAALVGALACALARMGVAYSRGKGTAEQDQRLRELGEHFERAQRMFAQLMGEDMAAYQRWSDARVASREEQQRALATAIAVPLEVLTLAEAVSERLDELKARLNPYLLSDLQTAALLANAAGRSAATHICVNAAQLADRARAATLEREVDSLLARTQRHCDAVMAWPPA